MGDQAPQRPASENGGEKKSTLSHCPSLNGQLNKHEENTKEWTISPEIQNLHKENGVGIA